MTAPDFAGKCILKATAASDTKSKTSPTVCRRWVTVER